MTGQAPGQTLQATALVHEAYLKLVGVSDGQRWRGRQHFFAAAAEAMRHILVDRARRRAAQKRGGGKSRREAAPLDQIAITADKDSNDDNILAVDAALERFAAADPQAAELVKLRYFVGMTIADAAAALDISPRTADRLSALYARALVALSNRSSLKILAYPASQLRYRG